MSWPLFVVLVVAGAVATFWTLHLVWRLHGVWRTRRAGPPPILATRHRVWHEIHSAEASDLLFGPGGEAYVPAPPFEFVEELLAGSHPCVSVRDANNRLWRVKWGAEAKPETFCVDSKDRRDVSRGSNTAIFEHRISRFAFEARYLIIDWGGAMGKWGTRSSRAIAGTSTGSRRRRRDSCPAFTTISSISGTRTANGGSRPWYSHKSRALVLQACSPDHRTRIA